MKSIRTKLILSFSVVVISSILIISIISITTGQKELKNTAENSLQILSEEGARTVESRLSSLINSLTYISQKKK